MLKKRRGLAMLSLLVVIFGACTSIREEQVVHSNDICPALPKAFTENDLIGTWLADYANGNTDKVIIREDGTYKQIFSSTVPGLSFESDWQKWWVERRDSGYIRLHLENMQRCDDLESMCQKPGGGVDPNLFRTIDYCEDASITMEQEVILIVTGTRYSVPKGVVLRQTKVSGSDWSYFFEYQVQDGVEDHQ